jgi:hypothetical protein
MAYKYLLTSGQSTTKIEDYVIDLFRLYLQVNPGDIPHSDRIGFDFTLTDVKKDSLKNEVEFRVKSLMKNIQERFNGLDISITSLDLIDEEHIKLVIQINGKVSGDYYIDLYQNT